MATSAFTRRSTASAIITGMMTDVGLTPPADIYGSSDQTVQQLIQQFNQCGQDLCMMHDWEMLHKTWTQAIVTATTSYALPTDFNGFIDGSGWGTSSRWPLLGSVTPQVWRMLKARNSAGALASIMFKIEGDYFVLFSGSDDTLNMDYYSRGWLQAAGDPTTIRDNMQANDDVCYFDPRLISTLLKVRWRASKGFDTSEAVEEFNLLWDRITGRDIPAMTLSVSPNGGSNLLGFNNIPDTNYGS
jgi:hypothetical protein